MGTRNDDLSLKLAKAVKEGFLPDVKDSEIEILAIEAGKLFGSDLILKVAPGARTIVLGDSIDQSPAGWFGRLSIISNQRLTFLNNAGIGGNTTAQCLARIYTEVIALKPDICIIGGGTTNDHSQGVTEETTRANLQEMYETLISAGIKVVVRNCPPANGPATNAPWNTTESRRAVIQRHNTWLKLWAEARSVPLLDIYSPLVDAATGGMRVAVASDSVHPTEQGHADIANYLLANLPAVFNGTVQLSTSLNEDTHLHTAKNGVFIGDSNADGVATGWNSIAVAGATMTPAVYPAVGNIQHVGGVDGHIYADTFGSVLGKVMFNAGKVKMTSGKLVIRFQGKDLGPFSIPLEGTFYLENTVAALPGRLQIFSRDGATANFDVWQINMAYREAI